ncbi:hypothetical protein [Streptomyces osmaniensis]|uniref:Uncharacterized protein n=1 Tax=Streptomyces osmaniensis TaxID=593134 RepID=A0ABP6Z1G9_9ACTN|nr:hypothetical protein KJK32_00290 [Streptomyces sp. JCM17656]
MRARAVLAAVALAGTVLFGGAGQALADDDDMGSAGADFGSTAPAAPEFDQGAFGSGQDATGMGQEASGFGEGGSDFDLG